MNKKELAAALAEVKNTTKKEAGETVDALMELMVNTLSNGEDVELFGFGKFKLSTRKAYTARNPQTGEPIDVPEKRVVTFKAAKALKEAVIEG
jgi:DNA-binding protein HU-beta